MVLDENICGLSYLYCCAQSKLHRWKQINKKIKGHVLFAKMCYKRYKYEVLWNYNVD